VTLDEYTETAKYWGEKHPEILKVETRAKASNGMPIYLLKITDSKVPDADKQVTLVASLHGGPERSGTATVLHLAEWLLGDDPEAVETRRKQVLLLMPINNPYAYFVTDQFGTPENIEPYATGRGKLWDLSTLTFTARGRSPEVDAYGCVFRIAIPSWSTCGSTAACCRKAPPTAISSGMAMDTPRCRSTSLPRSRKPPIFSSSPVGISPT
jgi:hypothetical protein